MNQNLEKKLPKWRRGVLVVSEMGWWEAYGNLGVACVEHRQGDDDETLNERLPYGYRGLIASRSIKGNGKLVERDIPPGRLVALTERFGSVMDKHPLLWLADVAEAMGVSAGECLELLLGQK